MMSTKRFERRHVSTADLGLLALRVTTGGLLMGHGAQKLFGWFDGHGIEGTGGWLESLGMRPGRPWAVLAGLGEIVGGLFTALGFLGPVGPLSVIGVMGMATATAHAGKPIWVTSGGAELPVTNIAIASAVALAGPGRLSLDHALGIDVPRWTLVPGLALVGGTLAFGLSQREPPAEQQTPSRSASGGDVAQA